MDRLPLNGENRQVIGFVSQFAPGALLEVSIRGGGLERLPAVRIHRCAGRPICVNVHNVHDVHNVHALERPGVSDGVRSTLLHRGQKSILGSNLGCKSYWTVN